MLIGELASRSGFSRDTIRFYEKQGLIQVNRKDRRENNYKEYSEQTLQSLLTIKQLKGFGFTLQESMEFLDLIKSNAASCDNVSDKLQEKVLAIEKKIAELQALKILLENTVSSCLACGPFMEQREKCSVILPPMGGKEIIQIT